MRVSVRGIDQPVGSASWKQSDRVGADQGGGGEMVG